VDVDRTMYCVLIASGVVGWGVVVSHLALLMYFGLRSFRSFMSVIKIGLDLCKFTTVCRTFWALPSPQGIHHLYPRFFRARENVSPHDTHEGFIVLLIYFSLLVGY
jgi:hypothetical protein